MRQWWQKYLIFVGWQEVESSGRMSVSFNVCSIFILEMLWPGMGVCNLISHSTHGINRLEKVSGKKKNLNSCLIPYSKSQPVQARKLAHTWLSCERPTLGHGSKHFPTACTYWRHRTRGGCTKKSRFWNFNVSLWYWEEFGEDFCEWFSTSLNVICFHGVWWPMSCG